MKSNTLPVNPGPMSTRKTQVNKSFFLKAAALAAALIAALSGAAAQAKDYTETTVYSFNGTTGGSEPLFSGVVRDGEGNFYGTTYSGGTHNFGTVFKIDSSGNETVLHSFGGMDDGRYPYAGLTLDPSGHLFGTTYGGGLQNRNCEHGCGVVFEISANGEYKVLHRFTGGADGGLPWATLIRDAGGNLYGTTEIGGSSPYGYGTVFKIDRSGKETVLYNFAGFPDAAYPQSGLIEDAAGNFYGTTSLGGPAGLGTVFKLDTSGHETVLHSFGGTDGNNPRAAVLLDSAGNLYGTTYLGGAAGVGTVFKIDPSGNETVLHSFGTLGVNDGAYAESTLVRDAQGNLYGTTIQGGSGGDGLNGIAFKINAQGVFSVIYNFPGNPGGGGPAGPLRMESGVIYGTTASGGTTGAGTVFRLEP
jgi:uncharacterized repeat protein (TIGR03803 family)